MKKFLFWLILLACILGYKFNADAKGLTDEQAAEQEREWIEKYVKEVSSPWSEIGRHLNQREDKTTPERNNIERDGALLYTSSLNEAFKSGAKDIEDVTNNYLTDYMYYDEEAYYYEAGKQSRVIWGKHFYDCGQTRSLAIDAKNNFNYCNLEQFFDEVEIYDTYTFVSWYSDYGGSGYNREVYYKTSKGDYVYFQYSIPFGVAEVDKKSLGPSYEYLMPADVFIDCCYRAGEKTVERIKNNEIDDGRAISFYEDEKLSVYIICSENFNINASVNVSSKSINLLSLAVALIIIFSIIMLIILIIKKRKIALILISVICAGIVIYVLVYFLYLKDVYEILGDRAILGDSYGYIHASCDSLANGADNIYEGKVESISFKICNRETGEWYQGEKLESDDKANGDYNPRNFKLILYTIYKVKVIKQYQGEETEYFYIVKQGGIENYRRLEQGILLKNAGITRAQFGRTHENMLGKTFLFVTYNGKLGQGLSEGYFEKGSEKYERFIEYLESDEFQNPPKPKDVVIDSSDMMCHSVEELLAKYELVFEGKVTPNHYHIREGKLCKDYYVSISNKHKGKLEYNIAYVLVYSGDDESDVIRQYRVLNSAGIKERVVYKDVTLLDPDKNYLFVVDKMRKEWADITNPAQFAFATDDSNSPGGITYSMIMEYLKKNN